MVIDIFHKLVYGARLFMKGASWGYFVLVFDSSSEPAALPRNSDACVLGGSGTEFEVARSTSCEESADATKNASMDHELNMGRFCFRA